MKKIVLLALLLMTALLAGGAPEALQPETAPSAAAVETVAGFPPVFPPPHCGDPCFDPGLERGCIDTSGSHWRRVQCICSGGTWSCW